MHGMRARPTSSVPGNVAATAVAGDPGSTTVPAPVPDPYPLAEPGILLRMLGPDATAAAAPPAGRRAGVAVAALLCAAGLGGALAAAVQLWIAAGGADLPFGRRGVAVVVAALLAGGALLGAAAAAGAALRARLGVAAAAAVVVAAVALVVGGPSGRVVALAAALVGLGLAAAPALAPGAAPWLRLAVAVVGAGAGVVATAAGDWQQCVAVLLACVCLAIAGTAGSPAPPESREPRWRRRWRWFAPLAAAGAMPALVAAGAWVAAPAPAGADPVLATAGDVVVAYARASQELRLWHRGELVDAAGPDRSEAPLAATLVTALARPGDRVLLLGLGTGRAAAALDRLGWHALDCVDGRPEAAGLRARTLADGPVPGPAANVPGRVRHAGIADALAALGAGSRQAVLLVEPPGPAGAVDVCQYELRRVVGSGPVLQVLALDRTPAARLHARFAAAAAANRWNGLFVVGDAAVLVGLDAVPAALPTVPFAAWPDEARWLAHEAHLGGDADLGAALLGVLDPAAAALQPEPGVGRPAALAVVRAWVRPAPAPAPSVPRASVLAHWSALQAELRAADALVRDQADDAAGRLVAQAAAARFLPVGAPVASLQATLGLPGADGVPLVPPQLASRRAQAIDPTLFLELPPVLATLPRPTAAASALEDLAALPAGARLAERCSGDTPDAVALRARFRSRCARALVAQLAKEPLAAPAAAALRELADAFVLQEAARALQPRAAVRELLGFWRVDLPMPAALAALVRGSADDRQALAAALRGRRDPGAMAALADLLVAAEPVVRGLAAEALWAAVGDRVPYDPQWPHSARDEAAQRLRALHNRAP